MANCIKNFNNNDLKKLKPYTAPVLPPPPRFLSL